MVIVEEKNKLVLKKETKNPPIGAITHFLFPVVSCCGGGRYHAVVVVVERKNKFSTEKQIG
jgi:hypothetical protein